MLVHHFDTVAGSLPNCCANHLLVRLFSASTTFSLFSSFPIVNTAIGIADCANLVIISDKTMKNPGKFIIFAVIYEAYMSISIKTIWKRMNSYPE